MNGRTQSWNSSSSSDRCYGSRKAKYRNEDQRYDLKGKRQVTMRLPWPARVDEMRNANAERISWFQVLGGLFLIWRRTAASCFEIREI